MKAKNGNWVKVKILLHIISIYGAYFPGMTATIPKRVAMNWVKNGIAVAIDDDGMEGDVSLMFDSTPDLPAPEDTIVPFPFDEGQNDNSGELEPEPVELEPEPVVEEAPVEPVINPKTKKTKKAKSPKKPPKK